MENFMITKSAKKIQPYDVDVKVNIQLYEDKIPQAR